MKKTQREEMDQAVLGAIRDGWIRAGDINQQVVRRVSKGTREAASFTTSKWQHPDERWMRAIDRSLQRLRRRGEIAYVHQVGWQASQRASAGEE